MINSDAPHSRGRLYCEETLSPQRRLTLPPKTAHYLLHVLRAKVGEEFLLFNAHDGEWRAEVTQANKKAVEMSVIAPTRAAVAAPDLWLVFAPIKAGRVDFLVEKATELGVSELYPVRTDYTNAGRINVERLHAQAVEAAEQTERFDVPVLHPFQPLERLLASWPQERKLMFCDESGGGAPLMGALAALPPEMQKFALLVGPEGGFSPKERAWLRSLPATLPVSLGPRILRAETAAVAALACFQAVRGDWQQPPRWVEGGAG